MSLRKKIYTYIDALAKRIDKKHFGTPNQSFVAMFHDITETTTDDEFATLKTSFIKTITEWQESGMKIVQLDQFVDDFEENKLIVLTFDDGFLSTYYIAKDYLIPKKIPFTIFINTGLLNCDGYMNDSQVSEMATNSLCTIGLHANKHIAFRYEKRKILIDDYLICKSYMDNLIGKKESYFYAFPYGSVYSVSRANCKQIKKMGCRSVFVTRQRKVTKTDIKKGYYIPRLNIPGLIKNQYGKKNY